MSKNKNQKPATTTTTAKPTTSNTTTTTAPAGDKPKKAGKGKTTWMGDKAARVARNVRKARSFALLVEANAVEAKLTADDAKTFSNAITEAASVVENTMARFLALLPAEFKGKSAPSGKSAGTSTPRKATLLIGAKVRIKADKVAEFAELFSVDELADLEVLAIKGKHLQLVTSSKARIVIPAKEVEALPAAVVETVAA